MSTASTASSTPSSNPWGVQLKKAPRGRNPVPNTRESRRLKEDAQVEDGLRNKRASLRKVTLPPRTSRTPKRTKSNGSNKYARPSSRGWKLRNQNTPLLGVVLRRLATIPEEAEEEDAFMDLDLMQQTTSAREPTGKAERTRGSGSLDESNHDARQFGVRLKPMRRRHSPPGNGATNAATTAGAAKPPPSSLLRRTYQIDLNPTQTSESGKDKSFLEVKLKPVPKSPTNTTMKEGAHEMVEFQMRHVVAPADGGPKKTASETTFKVPLLKPIGGRSQLKGGKTQDGLQDLLQMSIQNLKPPTLMEKGVTHQSLQIQLRQVDPDTQTEHILQHVVDVELKHREGPDLKPQPASTVPAWTMEVQLKPVQKCAGEEELDDSARRLKSAGGKLDDTAAPKMSIQLRPVTKPTLDDDSDESDELEDDVENSENNLLDCDYSEHDSGTSRTAAEEDSDDDDDDDDGFADDDDDDDDDDGFAEEEDEFEEEQVPEKRRSFPHEELESQVKQVQEGVSNLPMSMPNISYSTETIKPPATPLDTVKSESGSSSESSSDEDKKEEPPAKKEEEAKPLNTKKRRDLLMWYNRMRTPTKEVMKAKVRKLPPDCDITPEDVDQLPWLCGGKFLNVRVMNQMFMDDWQGAEEKKS